LRFDENLSLLQNALDIARFGSGNAKPQQDLGPPLPARGIFAACRITSEEFGTGVELVE
jgi:hypothetical protein